jgi:DNA-binding NtrC family response regulator
MGISQNYNRNIRILVVDDEELIRWSLQQALLKLGISVDVASSGEEALDMLGKSEYDIVITDYKMPGLSGIDLLAKIKEMGMNSLVILISAFLSHSSLKQASEYGAYKCVDKPFALDDFLGVVKEAVASRAA